MEEKRLTEILIPHDYEQFVRIVHEMGENWITRIAALRLQGQIVERLMTRRHADLLTGAVSRTLAEILIYDAQFSHLTQHLRNLLWLTHLTEEGISEEAREHLQQARWKPYDENAWDILFEQVVDIITPALDIWLLVRAHILAIYEAAPEAHPLRADFEGLLENGDSYAAKLEAQLNPTVVKTQRIWRDIY